MPLTTNTDDFVDDAMARAKCVLPVPGGPWSKIPLGGLRPWEKKIQKIKEIGREGTNRKCGKALVWLGVSPVGHEWLLFACQDRRLKRKHLEMADSKESRSLPELRVKNLDSILVCRTHQAGSFVNDPVL